MWQSCMSMRGGLLCLCFFWMIASSSARAEVLNLPTVNIMADHSLNLVVTEIGRNYARSQNSSVNTSFLPQKMQQEQIAEGEAADILITSKLSWIEELKLQGLTDIYSQTLLARDSLVLISAPENIVSMNIKNGFFPWMEIIKKSDGEPNLLLGNPEALMEGVYGKEALRTLGVSGDLEEYTLYIKSLEEMFSMVRQKNHFAICFKSTMAGKNDLRVIYNIPPLTHKPIIYYAVVIAGENMNEARKFLAYLKSAEVNKLFRKYGFIAD